MREGWIGAKSVQCLAAQSLFALDGCEDGDLGLGSKFAIIFGDDQDADGVFAGGGQDFLSAQSVADGYAVVGPEEVGSAFHAGLQGDGVVDEQGCDPDGRTDLDGDGEVG